MSGAFSISSKIIGHSNLGKKLRSMEPAMRKAIDEGLKEEAIKFHLYVIKGIKQPSPGKKYVRYTDMSGRKRRREGIAAAPGYTPNVDTGYMWKHIRVKKSGKGYNVGWWDKKASYPVALETGSEDKKLKPRPWLRPAWLKMQNTIKQNIRNLFKAVIKKT